MPKDSLAARRNAPAAAHERSTDPSKANAAKGGVAKNALEWAVFALSLALVAFVVAALVRGAGTAEDGPPRLVATLGAPEEAGEGRVRVPVALAHEGGQTVEAVTVEVTDGVRTATLDFGYAARGTTLEGAALLHAPVSSDTADALPESLAASPAASPTGPLRARVAGYPLP